MSRCVHPTLAAAGAVLLAAVLAGCSQQTTSGDPTNTGVLTGYEISNPNDIADGRKDRLGYRDFE
ncbi:MAG: hypothetical protein IID28_06890 [Planctomycetes bacterium]|nr:hypothetical protein [Planctomycetota bacterium]